MAALITREELGPDPDILSKFSAVAVARTACIEDNRARENARENIRKKLAMEAGREKQDSCDLQICFMNEIASDDELESENVDAATTAEALLRANISQKVGQIIVPMEGRRVKQAKLVKKEEGDTEENEEEEVRPPTREEAFQKQVGELQSAARQGLVEARAAAHRDLQERINSRRRTNDRLVSLLGLPHFSKKKWPETATLEPLEVPVEPRSAAKEHVAAPVEPVLAPVDEGLLQGACLFS